MMLISQVFRVILIMLPSKVRIRQDHVIWHHQASRTVIDRNIDSGDHSLASIDFDFVAKYKEIALRHEIEKIPKVKISDRKLKISNFVTEEEIRTIMLNNVNIDKWISKKKSFLGKTAIKNSRWFKQI